MTVKEKTREKEEGVWRAPIALKELAEAFWKNLTTGVRALRGGKTGRVVIY